MTANWSLAFEPLLPWVWLGLAVVLMAVLAVAGLVLRTRGAWVRAVAFVALAAALPATDVIIGLGDHESLQDSGNPLAGATFPSDVAFCGAYRLATCQNKIFPSTGARLIIASSKPVAKEIHSRCACRNRREGERAR